jgi:hypothetical protein
MTRTAARIVHGIALGIWAGSGTFFSGCVALKIFAYFRALPAQPPPGLGPVADELASRMAGDLISTIFPAYFAVQCVCGVVAAAAAWLRGPSAHRLLRIQRLLVTAAALTVCLHAASLYRQATALRIQQYAALDAGRRDDYEALRRRFFGIHTVSLALDLATTAVVVASLGMVAASGKEDG